jgi:hypothetical protein
MKVLDRPGWFLRTFASLIWSIWFKVAVVVSILWIATEFTDTYRNHYTKNYLYRHEGEKFVPFPFYDLIYPLLPIFLFWSGAWIVNGIWLWYIQENAKAKNKQ